jgi:hypothetical protein
MTPKDALGMLIRAYGLWSIIEASYTLFFAVMNAAGLTPHAQYPAQSHVLFTFFYFIQGIVIIKCADQLVEFAYPKLMPQSPEPSQSSSADLIQSGPPQ